MPEDQPKWRFPDNWTVIHANGQQVRIEVSQDGNTLTGTTYRRLDDRSPEVTGIMSGSVEGDQINLTIYWPDKSVAELQGEVSRGGRVGGTTVDRRDVATAKDWYAEPALSAWK